jgi:hypothetical protein
MKVGNLTTHPEENVMKDTLLSFFDPSRSIIRYIIGTAALTLVFQALYDLCNNPGEFRGGYILALFALVITILILFYSWRRQALIGRVVVREDLKPPKLAGLILMAGPSPASSPASIEYHLLTLKHCWIISTAESQKTASALAESYANSPVKFHFGSNYTVDADNLQSTIDLVQHILQKETGKWELTNNECIADITGGTKPMTAGMAMVCLSQDCNMEYMKSPRDPSGAVVKGATSVPVLIDTTFTL